jgi:hypothetical protein
MWGNDMDYSEFINNKSIDHSPCGFDIDLDSINSMCFDWQKKLIQIAIKRGRSALFEDCGLGKSVQELEWCRFVHEYTNKPVLIFTPLSVSSQFLEEAEKFNIDNVHISIGSHDVKHGINITNYEKLHKFDLSIFSGICLDEASIIKHFEGKFRTNLIQQAVNVPFKLAASATPSPNDYTELGNIAEFLGIRTRAEMLSMFFINDTKDTGNFWRLRGHAKDNEFWKWLASWAIAIQKPFDIGYDDNGFILPELIYHEHMIPFDGKQIGFFINYAKTLGDIRKAMRESMVERIKKCAEIVNNSDDIFGVWCNLNDESEMLTEMINGAVEVKGPDSTEHKERTIRDFKQNKIKAMVTKPKIAMYGLNLQNCNNLVVTGLSHSYEQFYQLIRRFWRFGQTKPVNCHIVIGEREGQILDVIKKKDKKMKKMYSQMVSHMKELMKVHIENTGRYREDYNPKIKMQLPKFLS